MELVRVFVELYSFVGPYLFNLKKKEMGVKISYGKCEDWKKPQIDDILRDLGCVTKNSSFAKN